MKKAVSVLLIVLCLFTTLSITAFAKNIEVSPIERSDYQPGRRYYIDGYAAILMQDYSFRIVEWTDPKADFTVPSVLDGYTVSSIGGNKSFIELYSYGVVRTITIPSSIKTIERGFGKRFPWLQKVQIRSGSGCVIKERAFVSCDNLSSVSLNEGIVSIGEYAFSGCKIKSITIPKSVTYIGNKAFGYDSDVAVSGFTIYGYKGSAAERYAKNNGFKFIDTSNLSTPKISRLENYPSGVKLTIGAVTGAAKYRVFVKNSGKWTKLGDTAGTTFIHKAAQSGVKYTYTVRCISADGKSYTSGYNTTGWTTTFIAAPSAPTLKNTKNGVQISWKRVAGAANYRIFRKTGNGKWTAIAFSNKAYVDKTAKNGVTYAYTIRCVSADKKSYTSGYNTKGTTIKCKR